MQLLPARKPPSPAPTHACDSHVHVFLPEFPYAASRQYTPPAATIPQLRSELCRLDMARVVLIQPSCYGTDNRALLAGLDQLGPHIARGVAVVDLDKVSDAGLRELADKGVRGIRFNLSVQQEADGQRIRRDLAAAQERCGPLGWHLQINASAASIRSLAPALASLHIPVVFDHFAGGPDAADTVLELLGTGRIWVKLSAPYRASHVAGYRDMDELVAFLVRANPQRLVWGSDWPHTGGTGMRQTNPTAIEPFRSNDALTTLHLLERWVPDAQSRHRILVDNPAELYGF